MCVCVNARVCEDVCVSVCEYVRAHPKVALRRDVPKANETSGGREGLAREYEKRTELRLQGCT